MIPPQRMAVPRRSQKAGELGSRASNNAESLWVWTGLLSLALKQGLGSEHLLVYPPKQRIVELHELLAWHVR